MGVLKIVGNDIQHVKSAAAECGLDGDELLIGTAGKKLAVLGGTPAVKTAVADLPAFVNVLNSPGLAIGSVSKAKVLIANTTYYVIGSALCKKTTAEITLAGTTANTKFAVYQLTINAAGTVTVAKSADADTLGAIVFPAVPASEACLGFVIVNPTGTGGFVGGTTELDDGTVIPNAAYINATAVPPTHAKLQALLDALQSYNLI